MNSRLFRLFRHFRPGGGGWRRLALALLAVNPALSAFSAEPAEESFSLRGFGTLGLARTSSDQVEFVRDLSQPRGAKKSWDARPDSLIGLQGNWHLSRQFDAVVQGISRYRYDRSHAPELGWAYLRYEPDPRLALRAGRLGTDFFMMADSRQIGYSYLTVRPPGDYFWHLPFFTIHGADAVLSWPVGEHVLRTKLFYGESQDKLPLADEAWNVTGSPMLGGHVEYQAGPWQFRLSYANLHFRQDMPLAAVVRQQTGYALPPSALDFLAMRDRRTHYYAFGMVFDDGPWQAQLMLNHIEQGNALLESSEAGYALLGYRVGQVTPFAGYSRVHSDPRNTQGNAQMAGDPLATRLVPSLMADSRASQHTRFLGVRWDAGRNVALKAQWDAIRGEAASIFPFRREQPGWSGRLDVFSLALDFIF